VSSRYNTIYLGEAGDVADELSVEDVTQDELRLALINALLKIERLEKLVAQLRVSDAE
jgi:hypothetical protein